MQLSISASKEMGYITMNKTTMAKRIIICTMLLALFLQVLTGCTNKGTVRLGTGKGESRRLHWIITMKLISSRMKITLSSAYEKGGENT